MDQYSVKLDVLQRWLAFVSHYVSLKEARLVTLGGHGLEQQLWQQYGVPGRNGWVVERGLAARRRFISESPYHYSNSLGGLPSVLRSVYGNGYADAVHLDLCGTLESQAFDFLPIMKCVVLNALGAKCLAVTVADQRQNGTLENFGKVRRRAAALFGREKTDALYAALCAQQNQLPCWRDTPQLGAFSPQKGAKKELGIMTLILSTLLEAGEVAFLPERIDRVVYLSHMHGRPFRMRTYFMRFIANAGVLSARAALVEAAARWELSPLAYLATDVHVPVAINQQPEPNKENRPMIAASKTPQYPKLASIVSIIGGETEQEFLVLKERAALADTYEQRLVEIAGLATVSAVKSGALVPTVVPNPGIKPRAAKAKKAAPVVAQGNVAPKELITPMEASLRLLRAKAKGESDFQLARLEVVKDLGWSRTKKRLQKLAALLARLNGGHRGNFVYRVTKDLPSEGRSAMMNELAGLYSRIGGVEVTAAILEGEVQAARADIDGHIRAMNRKRHVK